MTGNDNDIDVDKDTPIDLKGSEQHHKLKNQDGEQGDPDHNKTGGTDKIDDAVKEAVSEGDDDTAVGSALKKAIED